MGVVLCQSLTLKLDMAGLSVGELYVRLADYTSSPSLRCAATRENAPRPAAAPGLFPPSAGSIPQLYREVYSLMCPGSSTKVSKEVWLKCLKTASLPDATLEQVRARLWGGSDLYLTVHVRLAQPLVTLCYLTT